MPHERLGDAVLVAVVHERDGAPRELRRLEPQDAGARDLRHHAPHAVCADFFEQGLVGRRVRDGGVHDAAVAYGLGYAPRVHPADAQDAVGREEALHVRVSAEVGRLAAELPDDDGPRVDARTFEVLIGDAVVSQHREGEADQLAAVAGVRQAFRAAGDARGEHEFAHAGPRSAEALALQDRSVLQEEVGFRHMHRLLSPRALFVNGE